MIRKRAGKNRTDTLRTDHGSMWRTIRWTLRARTFWRFGRRSSGASGSGSSRSRLRLGPGLAGVRALRPARGAGRLCGGSARDLGSARLGRGVALSRGRGESAHAGLVGGHRGECRAAPFALRGTASPVAAGLRLRAGVAEGDHHPHVEPRRRATRPASAPFAAATSRAASSPSAAPARAAASAAVAGRRPLLSGSAPAAPGPAARPPPPPPPPARAARPGRRRYVAAPAVVA